MDFITGLPESGGSDTLWVIVDRLTKMAHFVPTSDTMKPEQLADAFSAHIFRPHGLPTSIISDRGSLFTSSFWTHIMKTLGTRRNLSTAFHPETDGQTERVNAIVEQYLRAYCNYQQDDWKGLLPVAEFCYNNTQSETTKVTPFFGNYGYHPRFLPDLGKADINNPEVSGYVSKLQQLHEELRAEIIHAQMGHAEQANKTRHPDPALQPEDKVWLPRKNIKTTRPSSKLDHNLIGPYTILEKVGTKVYKLKLPPTVRIHPVFHISLLEPGKPSSPIPGHTQPPPPPIEVNNEEEWEVEEILDSRRHRNKLQYRVKWTDFHDPDRSWYSAENFENAPAPIQLFHQKYPTKPAPIV
jgi:transposase InsO family protein